MGNINKTMIKGFILTTKEREVQDQGKGTEEKEYGEDGEIGYTLQTDKI